MARLNRKRFTLTSLSLFLGLISFSTVGVAQQSLVQKQVPATLAGHAVLSVDATVPTPKDAPSDMQKSGKYTTGTRVDTLVKWKANQMVVQQVNLFLLTGSRYKDTRVLSAWKMALIGC
ncbi:Uncharacterised protein [Providencia alcalifaciens]|nr:Uncharacterised protein [Providencia alcalifaciens]